MIANGMKAVTGKAYLLISGLTPMPHFTDPASPWTPDGYGPETPNCYAHYFSGATFSDTSGDNQFSGDEDLWEDQA